MRILFLTRSFNSLAQRLYLELTALGHAVAVEFDIADSVTEEAVALFKPDLLIAPFLKRAIPESVWRALPCLIVHPGVAGDRGPSALDWAILNGEPTWGATVLQAVAEMDAGPVWATETFTMRAATKSSLYRQQVTAAAARAVLRAVAHFEAHGATPPPAPPPDPRGRWQPLMRQGDRAIDWARDDTATVLRKLRAADGSPGVLDALFGVPCYLFDGHAQPLPVNGPPGEVMARRDHALLRATVDGAVWIGRVRRVEPAGSLKLPATQAFAAEAVALPQWTETATCDEIRLEIRGGVVALHFAFHNGAMGTAQCQRLLSAIGSALALPQPVLLLTGGPDFWSNGIHLNLIEAADSAADESGRNINAINDVTRCLIEASGKLVIAAMQGNAGAGGVFMALAADEVWAWPGVVLNPHYKNMGNLHGSEYWTYLLPRRLRGGATVHSVMGGRLPVAAAQACAWGLVDAVFGDGRGDFMDHAWQRAAVLACDPGLAARLAAKAARRARDEAERPLQRYRDDELARMRRNFYGFDPSYHIARSNFVRRVPPSWTPRHLARHRDPAPTGN